MIGQLMGSFMMNSIGCVRAVRFMLFCAALLTIMPSVADAENAWQLLREGRAVLIMRHALAPGVGDPAEFTLSDCSTQRNLNAEGLAQAKLWKHYLAEKNIVEARVFASEWCRTRDTATAMDVGQVVPLPALNSFFEGHYKREQQTRNVRLFVNNLEPSGAVILVTHQVNIQALAGVFAESNQAIILALPLTESPDVLASVTPVDKVKMNIRANF